MSFLLSVLTGFKFLERHSDDDIVDKLHYSLTTNILIGLSILVSWKQFGGKPMECMPPDHYPNAWEQSQSPPSICHIKSVILSTCLYVFYKFVENFCWAQDTYYVPDDIEVPIHHQLLKEQGRISYYQWVPFLLIISSMTFQLPFLMWKFLSGRSGIKLSNIIQHAGDPKNVMPDVRPSTVRLLAVHLENAFRFHKRLYKKKIVPHKYLRFLNLPYTSCYVSIIYVTVKLFYVANAAGNFLLMNYFLNGNKGPRDLYGWSALSEIVNGSEWHQSGFFPRVTLCDFRTRTMGQNQKATVQCVLVINIFNEKIFVFLWFWYHILILVSTFSLIYWLIVSLFPCLTRGFVTRNLELADMPFDPKESALDVQKFVDGYLKTDGVFALRMISMHTGIILTSEIVAALWKSFYTVETQVIKKASTPANRWPPLHSLSQLNKHPATGGSSSKLKLDEPDSAPVIMQQNPSTTSQLRFRNAAAQRNDVQEEKSNYLAEEKSKFLPENKSNFLINVSDQDDEMSYYKSKTNSPNHRDDVADSPYAKVASSSSTGKLPT